MAEQSEKKVLPPYVSKKTFASFIAGLREHGTPSQIDRGVLAGMSGSAQSALMNGLTALGLMDAKGVPTNALRALVKAEQDSDDYKAQMRGLLKFAFPYLFAKDFDLKTTTTNAVQQAIRTTGASGSTVAKAIAFFLASAKESGVEISRYVRVPPMSEVGSKKRATTKGSVDTQQDDEDDSEVQQQAPAPTVDLHPALAGVLQILPAPGQPLPAADREVFLAAFQAVLALVYPTPK